MSSVTAASPVQREILLCGARFLALGLLMGCWATGLPGLKARFGYTEQQLALVLLALAAGSVLAFLSCAAVSRAVGATLFTRVTGALAAYSMLATQLVSDSVPLALTAFVFGWSSAAFDVAINSSAVALEARSRRAIMSKLHAMFSSGGALAAAVAAGLWLAGGHALWLAVPAALLLSLLALAPGEGGGPAAGAPPTTAPARRSAMVWRLGAAALLCLLCEGTMYDWSAIYMAQAFAASPAVAVAGFGVFSAAMAFGRFTGDRLRDRHGSAAVLLPGCALAALGAGLCVWGGAREAALLGFVLVGLGLSNVIPIVFALAPQGDARAPEAAIAFVSGIGFVGFLVGPPLVGLWSSVWSFGSSLLLVVAACAGVAVLAAGIAPRSRP
ncbi:MFS transporter [Eleftheria terrae]|uniref:MFS transporter n=1 Tax=Eleftheria terrae TaxID=1597781 RepID=UPI00263A94E8|nr:MFS transporter [Eleftheria terrae]WKB51987.1 MFS transporter [Eleftheria terrae]